MNTNYADTSAYMLNKHPWGVNIWSG